MISPQDFWPAVAIGALQRGNEWRMLTDMHIYFGATYKGLLTTEKPFSEEELNAGIRGLMTNKPYLRTAIWRSLAQRALRQTGDAADAIVSPCRLRHSVRDPV
jgi:hypothetical protein